MLVAMMNSSWNIETAIEPFLRSTRRLVETHTDLEIQASARKPLRAAWAMLRAERYYECCTAALECRVRIFGIEGPGRIEVVGPALCRTIRATYPISPPGFERVGRMRQTDRPKLGGFDWSAMPVPDGSD